MITADMLRDHGVTLYQIRSRMNTQISFVRFAMNVDARHKVTHGFFCRAQDCAAEALREAGWDGKHVDLATGDTVEYQPYMAVDKRGTRKAVGSLHTRGWTKTQFLLRRHGVTIEKLVEESGLPETTVRRCLKLRGFQNCKYINLIKVRAAAESLLLASEWSGGKNGGPNLTELWNEYDLALDKAA